MALDDSGNLPPMGRIGEDDHSIVSTYLAGLARESADARAAWDIIADDNLHIYTYGDLSYTYGSDRVVVNEIQNAVIAATDLQTREAPTASLEPVETGEPAVSYWAGPPQVGMQVGVPLPSIQPMTDPLSGAPIPLQPLDPLMADALRAMAGQGMLKTEWIVDVDDKLVADTFQLVFDVYWARSGTDRFIRQNLLTTNVIGWTMPLYEFDDDEQRHVLRHMSIRQTYIDPNAEDIADAAYAGVDMVLDADQAISLYPDLAEDITAHALRGQPDRPDEMTSWGESMDRDYQRPMIVIRVFWLRDQAIPMGVDEAVNGGHVQQAEFPPMEKSSEITDIDGGTGDRAVEGVRQGMGGGEGVADDASASGTLKNPTNSEVVQAPAVLQQPPRIGFVNRAGDEVEPSGPGWPTHRGIRQITVIAGNVVDDRECEHFDIPLLHNVNLPLPGRPWGMGEPFRLYSLQRGRSRMLDALVEHCEYFKAPITTISRSMYESLPDEFKDGFTKPGMFFIVPDDQWALSGGKLTAIQDPPTTPPALVQMQQVLRTEIGEQSGHTDVLRGISPSAGMSGKALDTLQQGATSMIGFKSQRTGDMIHRLARLMLHSIVHRLSADDIGRIIKRYPPDVLAAICERGRQAEWEIKVIVASGSGSTLQAKKQEALNEYQVGAMSMESLREVLGLDHQQEEERTKAQLTQQMQMAGQAQQESGQAVQKEGKSPASNNAQS